MTRAPGLGVRRVIASFRALGVGLLMLCAGAGQRQAEAQTLSGRIVDSVSSLPLAGADVALLSSTGTVAVRVAADSSGDFSLHAPRGMYKLQVVLSGYRTFVGRLFELKDDLPPHVIFMPPSPKPIGHR